MNAKDKSHSLKGLNYWAAAGTLSLLLFSCAEEGPAILGRDSAQDQTEVQIDRSYNVRTDLVDRGQLLSYLDLSGEVQARSSVEVYGDSAGKLSHMSVSLGDYVVKGQQIALVDPSRPGMVYAASPVTAPVSGTITAIFADPGMTVSPQVPLVQIGQLDQLLIKAQVPERFIDQIEVGQRAQLGSTAYAGQLFDARVTELSPVIHPASRTMEITLEIQGESPLKAGMFLGIRLVTDRQEDCLLVDQDALMNRGDQHWVFVVEDDLVNKVLVQTGQTSSGQVEILQGLQEGQEVVIEGKSLLSQGSRVQVINQMTLQDMFHQNEGA